MGQQSFWDKTLESRKLPLRRIRGGSGENSEIDNCRKLGQPASPRVNITFIAAAAVPTIGVSDAEATIPNLQEVYVKYGITRRGVGAQLQRLAQDGNPLYQLTTEERRQLLLTFGLISNGSGVPLATFRRKNALSDIGRATLHATDAVFCGDLPRVHPRARGEWTVPA